MEGIVGLVRSLDCGGRDLYRGIRLVHRVTREDVIANAAISTDRFWFLFVAHPDRASTSYLHLSERCSTNDGQLAFIHRLFVPHNYPVLHLLPAVYRKTKLMSYPSQRGGYVGGIADL